MNPETNIQNSCLLATGDHPDVLCWRQQSGVFRTMDGDRVVSVGQPGMADLGMIVPVLITAEMVGKTIGVAVQPEVKTRTGRQASDQQTWQAAVARSGGVYRLLRSANDMQQLIADVRAGKALRRQMPE